MAEIYFQKMTPTGYHEIETQIEELKQKRPTLIARLKAARALGDLSENTEYSSAKRDLRHLESRLRYLDKQLKYAQIIIPREDGKVDLGSFVTIEFLDDHSQIEYQLVENGEKIYDKKQGAIRPIEYRDIAILAPTRKNNLILTEEFKRL